jgi:hypothetical protein
MKPITYYADSPAAQSFARVYGDRLERLKKPERMYLLLSLGLSLFQEEPLYAVTADLDPDGEQDEALGEHLFEQFDGQDERTWVQMIQAIAMTLENEP